jgi:pantoate--beta-alanine ligase
MIIIKKAAELKKIVSRKKAMGLVAGLVPTMGALHKGHLSLLTGSKQRTGFTVCSIFVNPAQFNNKEDFDNYPLTTGSDVQLLENNGCDILFLPSVEEMYPGGMSDQRHYDLQYLDTVLEGKHRPGHFQGVCNAVHRLLLICEPDVIFLGQKDYQQCMVIKKMIELVNPGSVRVEVCPTVREANGLAMSSRNMRLSPGEITKAGAIFQSLQSIKENLRPGNLASLKTTARTILSDNGLNTEYIEMAAAETLQLINEWDGHQKLVALVAAYMNKVRLIDNMLLN